jgi:DNA-binding winged helix-turn-helix (wHTH) protein
MAGNRVHRDLKFGSFALSVDERVLRRDGEVLPLGGRALDILIYLAERSGEVIAKSELIDHAWPDVIVDEGSLRVHVAAIRKALRDGQFGDRYIANIKGRGYSFVGTVGTVIRELGDPLRDERFVTLLGPSGIGKTTIAPAIGSAVVEESGGEVHFIGLESLTDPGHIAVAIATSLGLALKSNDRGPELADLIRSPKLIIVLDSCEPVIEAVALLAEQLYRETAGRGAAKSSARVKA